MNSSNAVCPHLKNLYRSLFRWYSISTFCSNESFVPNKSAITEWSITNSAGESGFTFAGSPPRSAIASRIVARSTMQGTPVKSCIITRAGVN
ncbi:unannotated protein [freshwater metagenome]|uniref:Unannotated protein n=1 Tax=freshwater metagenome TaxID=449393 RepID=A0A6J6VKI1_9ZZZZ